MTDMGYIKQHSILVTGTSGNVFPDEVPQDIEAAHEEAKGVFGGLVSELIESKVNGYKSFFIAPDGSKEGWSESDEGDQRRHDYKEWLKGRTYSDGSSSLSWVEVWYGEDNNRAEIVEHN